MISVVVPAYNEEKRIGKTLEELVRFLKKDFEIIVVDDGTDSTQEIAALYPGVRVLHFGKRLGKGGALVEGIAKAEGSEVIVFDADAAMPASEIPKLLDALKDADVAIASRHLPSSSAVMPLYRVVCAGVFNFLVRLLFGLPFHDTQCGFKAFRANAVKPLLPLFTSKGFVWDVDLLVLAREKGLRVTEVPVEWTAVEGGPVEKEKFSAAFSLVRDLVVLWRKQLK